MKNSKQQNNDLDLFSPIQEIFHEVCMMVACLFKELAIWGYRKLTNKNPPLEKINSEALKVKKTTKREDSLGIDTKTKKDVPLSEIDFKRHSFIIGASGFGKTNLISILQEQSLRSDRPIVFFDPKGDLEALQTFKKLCAKYKRPCYIFSEHYSESISLNPVLEGSINQIVDRIMRAFEWSDPYYRDTARRSLTKALQNLEKKDQSFSLQKIYDELIQMETKENVGLITKLEAIVVSDFGKILNAESDGLTLSKIREERAALYIGLSTQGYGETAMAIGKLFLGELLHNSYKSLTSGIDGTDGLKNPISVYFDEFGSIVTSDFIELQNKCRGAGMELIMAVQSPADINRVDPNLTTQIMENASNIFVFKQRMKESATFLAESIGTVMAKKQTFRTEDGEKQSAGTERDVHELAVHADIIKNLGIGQCIFLRHAPVRLSLINIRNKKMEVIREYNKVIRKLEEAF